MPFPNRAQLPYVWGAKLPPNQLKEKKMYMAGVEELVSVTSLCSLFFVILFFTINPTNNS